MASTLHTTQTDGKGGVVRHAQASGKSLFMVYYGNYLQEALKSPALAVITDRNDSNGRLYGQFARCQNFLHQTSRHMESRKHLTELLAGCEANGIIRDRRPNAT